MFSTANLNTAPTNTGSKYLTVGINDDATLEGFTVGESKGGKPYLEVTITKGDESAVRDKFYFSPAAQESSLKKVVHLLVDGLGVDRAVLDKAGEDAADLDAYAAAINKLVPKGKTYRQKFTGEEYLYNGDVKVGKRIGFIPFAEPAGGTTLTYDKAKKGDYTALPAAEVTTTGTEPDLPF